MQMQPTPLERDILSWIAARNPSLANAISRTTVHYRLRASAFFTYLTDEGSDWDHPPIDGPVIVRSGDGLLGGSILWLISGQPACLEVYALGDENFTEELDGYELAFDLTA
jgi:hypothetical protein